MHKVSVVIPTRDEEKNIAILLSHFNFASGELEYETIVVDDSTDKTAERARENGARVLIGQRKGLGQAIVDGIGVSQGDIVVVMDADLSHNPHSVPDLVKPILEQGCDMTIGSRYVAGGDLGNWSLKRKLQSIVGVKIMQLVTGVRDSNSGFFAFRKDIIEGVKLNPSSWKIMLEVLFKGNITVKKEIPIQFSERWSGESKNNFRESVRQAKHLIKLLVWKFRRYITFACVGGIGAIWYFGLLYFLTEHVGLWYGLSAIIGTLVAFTNNYLINHYWTFRHMKANNRSLLRGWIKYLGNSALGDGADWCVLILLTEVFGLWYMLSALLASGLASIIKYNIANRYIWGGKKRTANTADYEWHSFFRGLPWQKFWKHTIANAVRKLAGNAGDTLDIGCGSSPAGILVNHNSYTGLDKNASKMEFMRRKIMNRAKFETGTVSELPYKDNNFDTVLFIEAIEHLNSWEEVHKALEEISRVLKDNGTAIIATPNYGGWTGRVQDKLYGIFQPTAYADEHKIKFNPETLADICKEHNLILQNKIIPLNADMVCKFTKT